MILITGFTGNTGSFVLSKLLNSYESTEIIGLTRSENYRNEHDINVVIGELSQPKSINKIFNENKISGIIHIANIKYSPLIMEMASQYKVRRVVLVHTTGVYSKYREYSKLYKEIESEIMNKVYPETSYVIVRPTMIYGNERDYNMHKLIKFLDRYPVFPVFGDGSALMQPVHVEDLADAIIVAFQNTAIQNEDYNLSGGSVIEYKKILSIITNELRKKVFTVHIPMKMAIIAAEIYNKTFSKAILTVQQVERLQEDKAYSNNKAKKMLNFNPK